ncbi:hypothetical protein BpHYR1_034524 [Brachionus plicatilis]|uniref:Uncharacterized protein n=1 Tax=Brachionus plicatilis TaxID=10195 RepID=A0A3M7Q0K4_BRAPC|nr:hypothetical protein BpHYR1_034524 [Brachionus plicatilis]
MEQHPYQFSGKKEETVREQLHNGFLRRNLNKEKNNPRLILSIVCKDNIIFLVLDPLELQRSFNSANIGLNVSVESKNVMPKNLTFSSFNFFFQSIIQSKNLIYLDIIVPFWPSEAQRVELKDKTKSQKEIADLFVYTFDSLKTSIHFFSIVNH